MNQTREHIFISYVFGKLLFHIKYSFIRIHWIMESSVYKMSEIRNTILILFSFLITLIVFVLGFKDTYLPTNVVIHGIHKTICICKWKSRWGGACEARKRFLRILDGINIHWVHRWKKLRYNSNWRSVGFQGLWNRSASGYDIV